jgi:hypothetical protein
MPERAFCGTTLDLGANAKLIHQSLDTYTENAYALDLGSAYRLTEKITAGCRSKTWGQIWANDSLPSLIKAGADGRLFKAN